MIRSNIGKKLGIGVFSALILIMVMILILFHNELRSLATLKVVDDYPMYQMVYYGDYGFDDFLKVGAESDSDIERFVMKRLLKGMPINFNITETGCTAFVTKSEEGDILFARNFDFTYAPSLQVWTKPKNGYASVSTVNLSFAGYSKDNIPTPKEINSFLTLAAPYLPFDGMNEKGVAMALLAVPEAQIKKDKNKITLNTTTAIRLILDKAATVNEAIELLHNYNIYFSGGTDCHYLIADATGKSVIVEYWDGGLQVIETDKAYHIASNFIVYKGLNIGDGYDEFERYDVVKQAIEEQNGVLTKEQTLDLLVDVGIYGIEGEDKLQWSVVYNMTDLCGYSFAHRNIENVIDFTLK